MRKDDYLKYLDPAEFTDLYKKWAEVGKPKGNDKLYIKIWEGVTNAVKACIGALQAMYHCKYQDYDNKVMDSTILIMNKLLAMDDTPKNIVNMCYLPVLGICCGPKARQKDFEDNMLSTDNETECGDAFIDMIEAEDAVYKQNY